MLRASLEAIVDRAADRLDAFNRSMNPVEPGAGIPPALQAEVDAALREALLPDLAAARADFADGDEFLHRPRALPSHLIARLRAEADAAHATRSVGLWHRRAGSVGYRQIQRQAPVAAAIYRSPVLLDYLRALTGKPLMCRPDDDDHACTFYVYTRAGDHMGYHYDICGCEDGAAYSCIIGVVDDSTQRLLVQLHRHDPARAQALSIATAPGTFIAFSGSKLWHAVSRLGRGERRISMGLAYVTTTHRPPLRKLVKVTADTVFHFGLGGVLARLARPSSRASARDSGLRS